MFECLDAIITIGRDMNALLMSYPRMSSRKINLIPNWATLPVRYREIDPKNPFRTTCQAEFLVAMSGNAGFTHDPTSVFEAARLLVNEQRVHFLLSGWGIALIWRLTSLFAVRQTIWLAIGISTADCGPVLFADAQALIRVASL